MCMEAELAIQLEKAGSVEPKAGLHPGIPPPARLPNRLLVSVKTSHQWGADITVPDRCA